jgi:hypothetical protein
MMALALGAWPSGRRRDSPDAERPRGDAGTTRRRVCARSSADALVWISEFPRLDA